MYRSTNCFFRESQYTGIPVILPTPSCNNVFSNFSNNFFLSFLDICSHSFRKTDNVRVLWRNSVTDSEQPGSYLIHLLLAHLWCAYAIPLALSVVRRPSSVVCVVSSNLTTADMKEII